MLTRKKNMVGRKIYGSGGIRTHAIEMTGALDHSATLPHLQLCNVMLLFCQ